jgi:hypothetical protein
MQEWTQTELNEFAEQAEEVSRMFGYDVDFHARWQTMVGSRPVDEAPQVEPPPQGYTESDQRRPFPLAPGSIAATIADNDQVAEAVWAMQNGIDAFRVIWNGSERERSRALIERVSSLENGGRFILDIGDPDEYACAAEAPAAAVILVDARRPEDVRRFRAVRPASSIVPRLTRVSALLRWREFARESNAVYLSWPQLLQGAESEDLVVWLHDHYEEALTNRVVVMIEFEIGRNDRIQRPSIVEWAVARGLIVCASRCDTLARLRASVAQLAMMRG